MIAVFPVKWRREHSSITSALLPAKDTSSSMPLAHLREDTSFSLSINSPLLLVQRRFVRLNTVIILKDSTRLAVMTARANYQERQNDRMNCSSQIAKRPWQSGSRSSTSYNSKSRRPQTYQLVISSCKRIPDPLQAQCLTLPSIHAEKEGVLRWWCSLLPRLVKCFKIYVQTENFNAVLRVHVSVLPNIKYYF